MIRIDGFYLYTLGCSVHPLNSIVAEVPLRDWLVQLFTAQNALEGLLGKSVFQLRASQPTGNKLLAAIKNLTSRQDYDASLNFFDAYSITSALSEFEHVLNAEFGMMNLYCVMKKRGYDTLDLIENGAVLFPEELTYKVPEAIGDIVQATRCIAFELPTAAGFHIHRANESILHRWFDAVSNGHPRPSGRNIGDYLNRLNELGVGAPKVKSALKDLKDLHRNPLIHPEDSLESVDEAIALLGSVHAVVVLMLKDIPVSASTALVAAS